MLYWPFESALCGCLESGVARPQFLSSPFPLLPRPWLCPFFDAYSPQMGDPFSVAASAISVVSLGIQICQGLLSYYGDYKSYDDTIGSLCRKIEGLRSTLEICEEALQKPGLAISKASANVTKSIGACKDSLASLQSMLDSCKKIPKPQRFKASIHNYGQQTLYPFKKPNVLRLKSTVAELQDNVNTALLVLQM